MSCSSRPVAYGGLWTLAAVTVGASSEEPVTKNIIISYPGISVVISADTKVTAKLTPDG